MYKTSTLCFTRVFVYGREQSEGIEGRQFSWFPEKTHPTFKQMLIDLAGEIMGRASRKHRFGGYKY